MPEYMQEMLPDDNTSMPKPEENAQEDHRAFIADCMLRCNDDGGTEAASGCREALFGR